VRDRLDIPKSGCAMNRDVTPPWGAVEVIQVGNAVAVAAIRLGGGRGDGRKSLLVLESASRPSGEIDLQDQLGEEARVGCLCCGVRSVLTARHRVHPLASLAHFGQR
jgi:hypothetical protein